ncbi:MAG: response regulator [Rhizobiales bacterium]|nr:response regulator [Hyphomicrobiales bacterium]
MTKRRSIILIAKTSVHKIMNITDKTLLLVDDDVTFLRVLTRAMGRFGYNIWPAQNLDDARSAIHKIKPDFAAIDLHLGSENGLDLVSYVRQHAPHTKTVILSGYATLSTAVTAVKFGAVDCLAKPIDAEELDSCLMSSHFATKKLPQNHIDPSRAKIQHILAHWEKNDRNTSKTAEVLGMHRRSLQRVLLRAGAERRETAGRGAPSTWIKLRRLYHVWTRAYPTR